MCLVSVNRAVVGLQGLAGLGSRACRRAAVSNVGVPKPTLVVPIPNLPMSAQSKTLPMSKAGHPCRGVPCMALRAQPRQIN